MLLTRKIIPSNNPKINGIITFILVRSVDISVMLPIEDIIILYVPNIMSRAEEDTPGTTVPIASSIPDINIIIVSKMFPFII